MEKYLDWLMYHKKHIIIVVLIIISTLFLLGIGLWKFYFHTNFNSKEDGEVLTDTEEINIDDTQTEINYVYVDIKGAVVNPGVYKIEDTGRVEDAIKLAGGINDNGDLSVINLGKKVYDEMVIIIYTRDEVKNFTKVKEEEIKKQESCVIVEEKIINDACVSNDSTLNTSSTADTNTKTISLNTATKDELMTLSGIGESKALLIIEYRNTNGNFKTIDELKNVKGIGDSIFEKIKNNITV